jgi:hypothetical protein
MVNLVPIVDICEMCGMYLESILSYFETMTPKSLSWHANIIKKYKFALIYYLYWIQKESLQAMNKSFRDYSGITIVEINGITCSLSKLGGNMTPKMLFQFKTLDRDTFKTVTLDCLMKLLLTVLDNGFSYLHSQIKNKEFVNAELYSTSLIVLARLKRELETIVAATNKKSLKNNLTNMMFVQLMIQTTEI